MLRESAAGSGGGPAGPVVAEGLVALLQRRGQALRARSSMKRRNVSWWMASEHSSVPARMAVRRPMASIARCTVRLLSCTMSLGVRAIATGDLEHAGLELARRGTTGWPTRAAPPRPR